MVEHHLSQFSDKALDEAKRERERDPHRPEHPERIRLRAALLRPLAPAFLLEQLAEVSSAAHLTDQTATEPGLTPAIARGILEAHRAGLMTGPYSRAFVSVARLWRAIAHTARR